MLRDGRPVPLTPKAFDVLLLLVGSSGHIVEKDELMNRVWADSFVEEGNLKVTVSMLRKVLEEGEGDPQFIETVPRRGYRFTADVREVLDGAPQLMLLERTRADVIIEQEEEIVDRLSISAKESLITAIKRHRRGAALMLIAFVIAAAGTGYGLYRLFAHRPLAHFQTMKLKRLT